MCSKYIGFDHIITMIVYTGDSYPKLKDWVAESVNSKNHQGIYV